MTGLAWRVTVRGNLVVAVANVAADGPMPEDDPLDVSTMLARNNQENGCLDGDYDFASPETARHFAALCAGYMKNLSEKTIESLNETGSLDGQGWRNPLVPGTG